MLQRSREKTSPLKEVTDGKASCKAGKDMFMKNATKDWNKIIGENIRRYRMENHETQLELGQYLGFEPTTIANYERGDRLPDLITAYRIAEHYGIKVDDLMRKDSSLCK